jgi:hypothetical protein
LACGPVEHRAIDRGIGLGEGGFVLAPVVAAARHGECFGDVIGANHCFLAAAAPDQMAAEPGRQFGRGRPPAVVQAPVVDQGDDRRAGGGGEEFRAEEAQAQFRLGVDGIAQRRHQALDGR